MSASEICPAFVNGDSNGGGGRGDGQKGDDVSVTVEMVDLDDDRRSLAEWTTFLKSYARGEGPSDTQPDMPYLPLSLRNKLQRIHPDPFPHQVADTPLYSSTNIDEPIAREIRLFYTENGYLPPPRAPYESQRECCISEYNLYNPQQLANIKTATEMIASYFPDTLCTFSLFRNRIQTHFALSGPQSLIDGYQLSVGLRIPAEDSLCGHAVLLNDRALFVPNLQSDWRYLKNPFAMAGFQSFVGSSVSLQLDPSSIDEENPIRIGIGTLNICYVKEPAHMTPQQLKFIDQVTRHLEVQLRATWEGHHRTREAKARRAITDFIDEALVETQAAKSRSFHELVNNALSRLKAVLPEVALLWFIDTHAVQTVRAAERLIFTAEPDTVLWATSDSLSDQAILANDLLPILNNDDVLFTKFSPSGLESYLPADTHSHLVVPFFAAQQHLFVILAASSHSYYTFSAADINIVRSIGSILQAKAVQNRVIEADAAKTAFLSSISHELRTPMHTIMSGLELLRKAVDEKDWDGVTNLVALTESSGYTLRSILNDVLDFGRPDAFDRRTSVTDINLVKTTIDVAKVCMVQLIDPASAVSFMVEYEDRDWEISIDEARYCRLLINGLTNAMKFCQKGTITLSFCSTDDHNLVTQIVDTGVGFDQSSLPRLLQPFTKTDIHSAGAGLGLYITKTLVENMGGTLEIRSRPGFGTTFKVVLPVDVKPTARPPTIIREVLHSAPSPERALAATPRPSEQSKDPLRVLIVDDNPICLKVLRMALKKAPVAVTSAEAVDGLQALKIYEDFDPDLVLTDVSMPVMDGVTSAGRMRQISIATRAQATRIYALTGLGSSDPRMKATAMAGTAALDGWLIKGKDQLKVIYKIILEVHEARSHASNLNAVGDLSLEALVVS